MALALPPAISFPNGKQDVTIKATLRISVAIPATSMLKTHLGSNAMRHRWRQSSGSIDLDHSAFGSLKRFPGGGCPIAPGVWRDRRALTMTAALSHKSRVRCVLLNVRYVPHSDRVPQRSKMTRCVNCRHGATISRRLIGD